MSTIRRAASLPVAFFRQDAATVARGLLGATLVMQYRGGELTGRIVEVEAYLGATDPASHAFQYRRHGQNLSLYHRPGTWYVYRSYGMHWCVNLVTGPAGEGAAVLLRALEPLSGLATMRHRRGVSSDRLLCAGPGRLCEAMGIDRALDGRYMPRSALRLRAAAAPPSDAAVARTPRIGITRAAEWPLRYVLRDSLWASGPARLRR